MRLSDAGLRRHQTKLPYPNHRLPPWLTEDAAPLSLEPIVRPLRDDSRWRRDRSLRSLATQSRNFKIHQSKKEHGSKKETAKKPYPCGAYWSTEQSMSA